MNRSAFLLFFGASLTASALLACSSTSGGNTGGSTTTTKTSTSSSGTTTTTTGTTTTTTTAATLDCASYCGEVLANCTGANQQYGASSTDNGMANCMGFCATFSNKGALTDMSGDTLGCRIYHGGAAAAGPAVHCVHAGPTGGDKSVDGGVGTCGEPCDSFCDGAMSICSSIYTTKAACMTACSLFKPDPAAYLSTDTTLQAADTIGCRTYHLTAAAGGTAAATTHCPHISAVSTVCKN